MTTIEMMLRWWVRKGCQHWDCEWRELRLNEHEGTLMLLFQLTFDENGNAQVQNDNKVWISREMQEPASTTANCKTSIRTILHFKILKWQRYASSYKSKRWTGARFDLAGYQSMWWVFLSVNVQHNHKNCPINIYRSSSLPCRLMHHDHQHT